MIPPDLSSGQRSDALCKAIGLRLAALGVVIALLACGTQAPTDAEPPPRPTATESSARDAAAPLEGPKLVVEIDPDRIALPASDAESSPVDIGVFLAVRGSRSRTPWSEADAADLIRNLMIGAGTILAQCAVDLRLEAAHVITLPNRLLQFQANDASSWGGHPPAGTPNPALFNYQQNERLTDDARELFAYGKQFTSPDAIAVFTVGAVVYYAAQEPAPAGGVSFPPNVFHHADDYPLRNSVVLVPDYLSGAPLPARIRPDALAHELGHMLLNSGQHVAEPSNLMGEMAGTLLTSEQCDRMREDRERLYGDREIADPGPS